jgi:hypothetical protein
MDMEISTARAEWVAIGHGRGAAGGAHGYDTASFYYRSTGVKIENAGCVLVDPEHEGSVGEVSLHDGKAPLTQIAEAGVVSPALVVVVVGDDCRSNPRHRRDVESLEPVWIFAALVDFVNGHRRNAECQRRGACEHHTAAVHQLFGEQARNDRLPPLPQRVAGASRSCEDVA